MPPSVGDQLMFTSTPAESSSSNELKPPLALAPADEVTDLDGMPSSQPLTHDVKAGLVSQMISSGSAIPPGAFGLGRTFNGLLALSQISLTMPPATWAPLASPPAQHSLVACLLRNLGLFLSQFTARAPRWLLPALHALRVFFFFSGGGGGGPPPPGPGGSGLGVPPVGGPP